MVFYWQRSDDAVIGSYCIQETGVFMSQLHQ